MGIDGFALCGLYLYQDRLPDLPIISIENICARYSYLSNIVKKFSEKNVKAPDNFILFYVLLQQCLFIF